MNILIPDEWLKTYLKTDVAPKAFKERVSLSGVSVERVNGDPGHEVYDIEVTTNRVDCMSVVGIAREAAAILGPDAAFTPLDVPPLAATGTDLTAGLTITNDPALCRRITAVRLDNVEIGPSPQWMADRLTAAGQRPINTVVDVTNYVMLELGHPIHAFDYDRLTAKKIIVREAKKGERFTTLDGKQHVTSGGEVVFDDGTGTIIDLPGIMGTANTVVTPETKTVLLWSEDVDPVKIRQASMGLAIRTSAAVINEKHPDDNLSPVAVTRAAHLIEDMHAGHIATKLYDAPTVSPVPSVITLPAAHLAKYLGLALPDADVVRILTALGCAVVAGPGSYTVTPPTWRQHDMAIPEDVIEEVARIYGYHNLPTKLPDTQIPPMSHEDPILGFEQTVKRLLSGWGYTEIYPYSMMSTDELTRFGYADTDAYIIENPLSEEWVAMRPDLIPTTVRTVLGNLRDGTRLRLFELSMAYRLRSGDLPDEHPTLALAATGGPQAFGDLKGALQALFERLGISWTERVGFDGSPVGRAGWFDTDAVLAVGELGVLGRVLPALAGGADDVFVAEFDARALLAAATPNKAFSALPKYPAATEDLSLILPERTHIGPILDAIRASDPLVAGVSLVDRYNTARTVRITYRSDDRTVTAEDTKPVRERIIAMLRDRFGATLKG